MRLQTFDNLSDMVKAVEKTKEEAFRAEKMWQAELQPGDKVIVLNPDMPLFQELLAADPDEKILPQYMLVRGFSAACPEGEIGSACRCNAAAKLTEEEWESFRQNGWTLDESIKFLDDLEKRIRKNMREEI